MVDMTVQSVSLAQEGWIIAVIVLVAVTVLA
jgi:hypothetical protein